MSLKQIRWNEAKHFFPAEDIWDSEDRSRVQIERIAEGEPSDPRRAVDYKRYQRRGGKAYPWENDVMLRQARLQVAHALRIIRMEDIGNRLRSLAEKLPRNL